VQGPLARFVLAVTEPVMKGDTPSLESLPNIVDRQERFYAAFAKRHPDYVFK
jgi:hypothetical protein